MQSPPPIVFFIGPKGSGKSSLVNHLAFGDPEPSSSTRSSKGVRIIDFERPAAESPAPATTPRIQIWDLAGDLRTESILTPLLQAAPAHGIVLVMPSATERDIEGWLKKANVPLSRVLLVIIGGQSKKKISLPTALTSKLFGAVLSMEPAKVDSEFDRFSQSLIQP